MRKKVTVVGGGFVGSTTAQRIHDAGLADVVLDRHSRRRARRQSARHGRIRAHHSAPMRSAAGISTATGDYSETANSDIVVITAGFPRKPGMSRDDLLKANYDVIKGVVEAGREIFAERDSDHGHQSARRHGAGRVQDQRLLRRIACIGMAGVLDSARMSTFVAEELNVSVENVHSFVLGGHGDDMVPLPRYSTVAGIPLPESAAEGKASTRSWTARAKAAPKSSTC